MPRRSKYVHSTDRNHSEIVAAVEAMGFETIDCRGLPSMGCDFLAVWSKRVIFCEVKDGEKPASARRLTDGEKKRKAMCERHAVWYLVLTSTDDVFRELAMLRHVILTGKGKAALL
jgi:hypothetical protein